MQMAKKLLALLLAALLAFGTFAMTASAEPAVADNLIAAEKKFYIGDTISFDTGPEGCFVLEDDIMPGTQGIFQRQGEYTLEYRQYDTDSQQHWFDLENETDRIPVWVLSTNSSTPTGVEVGGEGTLANPFAFTVIFSTPVYTVTWLDENGDLLEIDTAAEKGTIPSYDSAMPTKAANAQYAYAFAGWSDGTTTYAPDALPAVTGNVTYTATFSETLTQTHDGVMFTEWTSDISLPSSGNWFLTKDVTISTALVVSGTLNLCLNGHGITSNSGESVIVVGTGRILNLYDCDTATEHKFTVSNPAANGAGLATVDDALTSGYQTFTGGYITGRNPVFQGGGVFVTGGTFNMYGGTIIGNRATERKSGAGVSVLDGTFAMHGGSILYNYADGMGAGVYVDSTADNTGRFIMTGGEIAYNMANGTRNGSNPYYYGDGGAVCSRDNASDGYIVYDLTGGTIHHNAGMEYGAGINFTCNNGTLNIGGDVEITDNYGNEGGVRVSVTSSTVNFSGAPVIDRNVTKSNAECNFYINNPPTIKIVGEMTNDTPIGVTMKTPGVITSSDDTSLNDVSGFVSENAGYGIIRNGDGQLAMVRMRSAYLDFGTGHETLAASFAQSKGYAVSGSRVTVPVPSEAANRWDTRNCIDDDMRTFIAGISSEGSLYDAGEKLYYMQELAPQPMSAYTDMNTMHTAMYAWLDAAPADSDVYYMLWEQAYTGAITLSLDPLTCGTEMTISNYGSIATNHTEPQPSYTVTGGESNPTMASWYDAYDAANDSMGSFVEGMIVGGTDYYTRISVSAPFGYYITDAEQTVTVTGAKQVWYPASVSYTGAAAIVESVTAEHGDWGSDAVVTVEPTESEEGELSYYCTKCAGLINTQTLPALVYHDVTVADGIQNGTVTVTENRMYVGSTVTVTAEPDDADTFLYRLYYSGIGQEDVTITENGGVYSFIMPDYDVTVNAEFRPTNMVYVDFGAGHEDFVQAAFGEAENLTVNGSVVSFRFVPDDPDFDNAAVAQEEFTFRSNSYINYYNDVDNGERYMYRTALHPLDYYLDTYGSDAETQVQNEFWTLQDVSVEEGITFYALWAQPVSDAVVTITPPACGTEMSTYYRNNTVQVLPSPAFSVTGGLSFEDYMIFYNNWSIGLHDGETTTLTGSNSYTAYGFLQAPWGSFLPDDLTGLVTFEGGTLTEWDSTTKQFILSVPVEHTFDADGICTGCGAHEPKDQQSVSIDDQIALNLLLDLDARGKTVNDVTITLGGTPYACTGAKVTGGDYDGLYKFKVVMAPAQIADEIVAVIDGDAAPLETSVKNYCVHAPEYYPTNTDLIGLTEAILAYGQAANNVFANGSTVPAADIADLTDMDRDSVQSASVTFTDGTGEVTGASFMALTKPEFRFYTENIDEQTAVAYNQAGVSATMDSTKPDQNLKARFVKKADGRVLLEVTGVSAENMDKEITVTVTGLGTITFNGNAFAKAMANSRNTQQSDLGALLYNYGAAAKTFFGA